jgi:hypothetical protein
LQQRAAERERKRVASWKRTSVRTMPTGCHVRNVEEGEGETIGGVRGCDKRGVCEAWVKE